MRFHYLIRKKKLGRAANVFIELGHHIGKRMFTTFTNVDEIEFNSFAIIAFNHFFLTKLQSYSCNLVTTYFIYLFFNVKNEKEHTFL